jgi:hypothetical protein
VIGQLAPLAALLVVGAGDAPAAGAGAPPQVIVPAPPDEDLPIAISWTAPDECPGVDALKAEIRRVAGKVPPPAEPLSANVTVSAAAGSGWLLTLSTKTGARGGERRLAGSDCAELMRAAALVLALMINPEASFVVEPPAPPPPPPPPPPEPRRRFVAGADVLAGTGALPRFAGGFGLRFAVSAAALSAELRGSIWMSRSTTSTSDPTSGGTFDLIDGAIAGCARAAFDETFSPGACAGVSLVRLHGVGYGVGYPGDAVAWWTAALGEVNVRARVSSRNAVRLAAQVVVPLGRPSFAIAGVGHVFEPAPIWLRGTLGWELHF